MTVSPRTLKTWTSPSREEQVPGRKRKSFDVVGSYNNLPILIRISFSDLRGQMKKKRVEFDAKFCYCCSHFLRD